MHNGRLCRHPNDTTLWIQIFRNGRSLRLDGSPAGLQEAQDFVDRVLLVAAARCSPVSGSVHYQVPALPARKMPSRCQRRTSMRRQCSALTCNAGRPAPYLLPPVPMPASADYEIISQVEPSYGVARSSGLEVLP